MRRLSKSQKVTKACREAKDLKEKTGKGHFVFEDKGDVFVAECGYYKVSDSTSVIIIYP